MINSDIKTASKLCNQLIREINERWAQDKNGRCYLIRRVECSNKYIALQPKYSETFYGISDFMQVAQACGCGSYVEVRENLEGIKTPTLVIH